MQYVHKYAGYLFLLENKSEVSALGKSRRSTSQHVRHLFNTLIRKKTNAFQEQLSGELNCLDGCEKRNTSQQNPQQHWRGTVDKDTAVFHSNKSPKHFITVIRQTFAQCARRVTSPSAHSSWGPLARSQRSNDNTGIYRDGTEMAL